MADQDSDTGATAGSSKPAAAPAAAPAFAPTVEVEESYPLACLGLASLSFGEDGGVDDESIPFSFSNLTEPRVPMSIGFDELEQLYEPVLTSLDDSDPSFARELSGANPTSDVPEPVSPTTSPLNFSPLQDGQQQDDELLHTSLHSQPAQPPPRARKRRSRQKKKVFYVSAEDLSSDLGAWRKYGQKPIKGCPYPRNYYRCSIWKGCLARKLVQRSPMDPNIFIVMHVGRHVHPGRRAQGRSSLVGGVQNRFAVATQGTRTRSRRRPVERPAGASRASPTAPLAEDVTDDEQIAEEDMAFDDDDDEEDPQLIPNLGNNPNQDIIVLAQELSKNVASPQE